MYLWGYAKNQQLSLQALYFITVLWTNDFTKLFDVDDI